MLLNEHDYDDDDDDVDFPVLQFNVSVCLVTQNTNMHLAAERPFRRMNVEIIVPHCKILHSVMKTISSSEKMPSTFGSTDTKYTVDRAAAAMNSFTRQLKTRYFNTDFKS